MLMKWEVCLLIAAAGVRAFCQAPQTFEVASVKPNMAGGESRRATASPGGRFTAENVSLKLLIARAFGVPEAQIQGGPSWIDSETWDIAAKANTPREMTREELRPCLQALLAGRFGLAVHHETRQGQVFSLVVAKNGPKLKEHDGEGSSGISASTEAGKIVISGARATMARLAEYLAGQAGRPVIDNTGLKGEYDFRLEWTTDAGSLSVFTAIQEQLGLKVEAVRGQIDTIVIDRATRASAN